jgi:hypothetical protein
MTLQDPKLLGGLGAMAALYLTPRGAMLQPLHYFHANRDPLFVFGAALMAWMVVVAALLSIWKLLTRHYPPKNVVYVLMIWLAARLTIDALHTLGFWFR